MGLIRDGAIVEVRCRVPLCLGEHASGFSKVDISLPGKGNSNSHGARPVHQIITLIKWIWTSSSSIKNSLSAAGGVQVCSRWVHAGRGSPQEATGNFVPGYQGRDILQCTLKKRIYRRWGWDAPLYSFAWSCAAVSFQKAVRANGRQSCKNLFLWYGVWGLGFVVWGFGFDVRGWGYGVGGLVFAGLGVWCLLFGVGCLVFVCCLGLGVWCLFVGVGGLVFVVWGVVFSAWCLGCGVWCLVFGIWCLGCGVWCLVFGVWCLVFGVWCLVFGVWCLVFGVWCLVFGVWCLVFDVWCLVFGVRPHFLRSAISSLEWRHYTRPESSARVASSLRSARAFGCRHATPPCHPHDPCGFRVQGSGFRVQGSGFSVHASGCRVQGSGFRVQGPGFRVQGSGFRVTVGRPGLTGVALPTPCLAFWPCGTLLLLLYDSRD